MATQPRPRIAARTCSKCRFIGCVVVALHLLQVISQSLWAGRSMLIAFVLVPHPSQLSFALCWLRPFVLGFFGVVLTLCGRHRFPRRDTGRNDWPDQLEHRVGVDADFVLRVRIAAQIEEVKEVAKIDLSEHVAVDVERKDGSCKLPRPAPFE